jgi:RHS repeat-associated protein
MHPTPSHTQQNRCFTHSAYRYAFNSMEKDDEVKGEGNSYTTEFRQYDARLGRWLSLDPAFSEFEWSSPYVTMANNSIMFIDGDGDKIRGGLKARKAVKEHVVKLNATIVQLQALETMARIQGSHQAADVFKEARSMYESQQGNIQELKDSEVVFHFKYKKNAHASGEWSENIGANQEKRNIDGKGRLDISIDPNNKDMSIAYAGSIATQFLDGDYSFISGRAFGHLADINDLRQAFEAAYAWTVNPNNANPISDQIQSARSSMNNAVNDPRIQIEFQNSANEVSLRSDKWKSEGHRDAILHQDTYYNNGKITYNQTTYQDALENKRGKNNYGIFSKKTSGWTSPESREKTKSKKN